MTKNKKPKVYKADELFVGDLLEGQKIISISRSHSRVWFLVIDNQERFTFLSMVTNCCTYPSTSRYIPKENLLELWDNAQLDIVDYVLDEPPKETTEEKPQSKPKPTTKKTPTAKKAPKAVEVSVKPVKIFDEEIKKPEVIEPKKDEGPKKVQSEANEITNNIVNQLKQKGKKKPRVVNTLDLQPEKLVKSKKIVKSQKK